MSEKAKFSKRKELLIAIEKRKNFKEFIWKSTYSRVFQTKILETYSFIKKETLPKVFYYKLYKVLIDIDICVEHSWKSAYIRKIVQPVYA